MGLFFNKEKQEDKSNSYLEDQQSLFNTKGETDPHKKDESYDEFIFKKKDYSDVPKYKASDEKRVDIVVDKDDFGFEDIKPDIKTVNIQKNDLHEDLSEIVNNAPVDESMKDNSKSIYDDSIQNEIKKDEPIEIIDINDDSNMMVSEIVEENIDKSKKLSIFGSSDEPIQAKVYDVKQAPVEEKIEIIEPVLDNNTLKKEAPILNEDGNKICPQCGAPIKSEAPACFLCGYKF